MNRNKLILFILLIIPFSLNNCIFMPRNNLKVDKQRQIEEDSRNQIIETDDIVSATSVIVTDNKHPTIFSRKLYEKEAYAKRDFVLNQLKKMRKLEKVFGKVTHYQDNGDKLSVDVFNRKGKMLGKLCYMNDYWVHQYVEWDKGKQNGLTAFFTKDHNPYQIYTFKDNKLDGPIYEFVKEGSRKGTLIRYIEMKNHSYMGLCLGWSEDGEILDESRLITEPKPYYGLP